jgi:hypothetical protein
LRCSCGAILPEDARFCHKCGQPQYEEDIARMNAVEEPPPVTAQPPAPPPFQLPTKIGIGNGRAVRITLAVAGLSLLAIALIASIAPPLAPAIMVAAGFTAVRVYLSRTSENLSPSGAAILGAMPWLWLAIPFSILEALGAGFFVLTPEGREAAKALKNPEVMKLMDDPAKLITGLLLIVFVGTVSGALGGILAVRRQPRSGPSH